MRLFLGNFDFEHQLAADAPRTPSAKITRLNAERAAAWLALATAEDLILVPEPWSDDFLASGLLGGKERPQITTPQEFFARPASAAELVPWGWSRDVLRWGAERRLNMMAPDCEAVAAVNCRLFARHLETAEQCGLIGSALIAAPAEVLAAVAAAGHPARWVLKSRFGMSGRECWLGRQREFPEAAERWLRKRLARDGGVLFEPWVENLGEAGLQWDIPAQGAPVLRGVVPLICTPEGAYLGSRVLPDPLVIPEWEAAIEISRRAAWAAQQRGYFGPLGIDAMRYRNADGKISLRPIQDINARWTMGRLALGWRRFLRPGELASWLHLPSRQVTSQDGEPTPLPAGCRLLATSPTEIGGRPCRVRSWLLIAESLQDLERGEQMLCEIREALPSSEQELPA